MIGNRNTKKSYAWTFSIVHSIGYILEVYNFFCFSPKSNCWVERSNEGK